MSTHAEISAAILATGYRDTGRHECLNRGCENLLDAFSIQHGFPGCMAECRQCVECRMGRTIEAQLARAKPRQYPSTGRIAADDPSICGCELLGYEGQTWQSFHRRHQSQIAGVAEPYRRGIGQGFGPTEDGEAE